MSRKDKDKWDLDGLLSAIGFVFELLRVVVNALRKRGGTVGHLRRLLKEPDLVDKVFDLIVVQPARVFNSTILALMGSTDTLLTYGRFVTKNGFKVDTCDSAEVKISFLGDNFKTWFLDKVEETMEDVSLFYFDLLRNSLDASIIQDLGGETKVETTLCAIWTLLKMQRNGEPGILLTNGYANIFYIKDTQGVLRAVGVYWRGGGWYVYAGSVTLPCEWDAGRRVFSRNF